MVKFVTGMAVVLVIMLYIAKLRIDNLVELNEKLETQKKECFENYAKYKNEIKRQETAAEQAQKDICEIRTVVKTVPSICDCYNSAVDSSIINRVRGSK